jgi:hypothetical protein
LALSACAQNLPGTYRNGALIQPRALGLQEERIFRFVDKWRIRYLWIGGPVDIFPCQDGGNPFEGVSGFDALKNENASPIIEQDGHLYVVGADLDNNIYFDTADHFFYGTNQKGKDVFVKYSAVCSHFFSDTLDSIALVIVKPDSAKGTDEWIEGTKPITINGLQWLRKIKPIRDWTGTKRDSGLVESWVLMIPNTAYWLRWTLYSGSGETSRYKSGAFHYPEKHRQIVDLFHQMVESVTLEPIEPVDMLIFSSPISAWEKPGVSFDGIKKALLECGYPSLSYGIDTASPLNDVALRTRCMEKSGFKYSYRPSSYSVCNNMPSNKKPTACFLPDNQIPGQSVEKRLNSKFCKRFSKSPLCQ